MISSNAGQSSLLNLPRISVVVPCFNGKRYIAAAISSVLSQGWPDIEIIVVDDGSSDGSAEFIRSKFPSVCVIQQPNQGVAAARNTGISNSSGDWIAFLDAHDLWLNGKLASQWQQLLDNPDARMSYTAWQVWESETELPSSEFLARVKDESNDEQRWVGASGWIYPELLLDCVVWTSTVLAHRSLFQQIGTFDRSLRIGEDYDLWIRVSRVSRILRVHRPFALYRSHRASITRTAPALNYQAIVIQRAIDRWALTSPDGAVANKAAVKRGIARTWSNFADASLSAGERLQAIGAASKSILIDWRHRAGWKVLFKSLLPIEFVSSWLGRPKARH